MLASNASGMISVISKYPAPLLCGSSLVGLGVCGATAHMIRTIVLPIASHKLSISCIKHSRTASCLDELNVEREISAQYIT